MSELERLKAMRESIDGLTKHEFTKTVYQVLGEEATDLMTAFGFDEIAREAIKEALDAKIRELE